MVMIILHLACIKCLVTNFAWNVHDGIGVYKRHHRAHISYRISYFAERAILRLAGTVIGEVGALNL